MYYRSIHSLHQPTILGCTLTLPQGKKRDLGSSMAPAYNDSYT